MSGKREKKDNNLNCRTWSTQTVGYWSFLTRQWPWLLAWSWRQLSKTVVDQRHPVVGIGQTSSLPPVTVITRTTSLYNSFNFSNVFLLLQGPRSESPRQVKSIFTDIVSLLPECNPVWDRLHSNCVLLLRHSGFQSRRPVKCPQWHSSSTRGSPHNSNPRARCSTYSR